jgi:hypothetical protein
MHQFCEVHIFLVIFSYDYEVLHVSVVHRFQTSVLGSCLGYICSYHYIIKWKGLGFGFWEEQREYGSNLISGGGDFTLHCSDLAFNSLVHSHSFQASSETLLHVPWLHSSTFILTYFS